MVVASRNFLSGEKSVSWRTRVTTVVALGFFRGSTLLRLPASVSRCVVTRPHECGGLNNTTLFSPVGEATVMSVSRGGERGVSRTFFWLLPGPWPRSSALRRPGFPGLQPSPLPSAGRNTRAHVGAGSPPHPRSSTSPPAASSLPPGHRLRGSGH